MPKLEFPPLFPAGFHCFALAELDATFVLPFAQSRRRPLLMAGLKSFASELAALRLVGELWFDGSFVCAKNEPDDVDVLVVVDSDVFMQFSEDHQRAVEQSLDHATAKALFHCDVYCVLSSDVEVVSYWRGWFGFQRDGKTPKRIGYISL